MWYDFYQRVAYMISRTSERSERVSDIIYATSWVWYRWYRFFHSIWFPLHINGQYQSPVYDIAQYGICIVYYTCPRIYTCILLHLFINVTLVVYHLRRNPILKANFFNQIKLIPEHGMCIADMSITVTKWDVKFKSTKKNMIW